MTMSSQIDLDSPTTLSAIAFAVGCLSTITLSRIHRRYFRRFPSSEWVTPDVLKRRRWVKGVVTSVGDADNFRLYHTPGFGWRWPLKFRLVPSKSRDLKDQTLHIRMAGVDAPEAAHFGKPAQAYSAEALAWLKERIDGKTVYCQLVSRDQYMRLVAIPMLPPRLLPAFMAPRYGRCLSLEMLQDGWATTYEQAGAVYGHWGKDAFLRVEELAKSTRRGQWKKGVSAESPAEYKRRHSQASGADLEKAVATPASRPRRGWFSRVWRSE